MSMIVEKLINTQIVLPDVILLPDETKAIRSILLADSEFNAIASRDDAEAVGKSARDIRTHIKTVREMGMALRRPIKAIQDRIKAIEDEYCQPLEDRQGKLEGLVTGYAKAEAARVAEEERKRQAEVRRIENERLAAEQKAREEKERIEREAREAEEKLKAQSATMTTSELFKAGREANRLREEAEAAKAKADADAEAARLASSEALSMAVAAPIEAHKIAGVATKRVCKWAVTDEGALFKSRPELFKVELKRSAVNSTCFPRGDKATAECPDATSVPGLSLWWENEAVTRAY